jgi:hypothetical protein
VNWFNELGSYGMFFADTPALAVDFSVRGPRGDFGYRLANSMQRTPTVLEPYPSEGIDFSGLGE